MKSKHLLNSVLALTLTGVIGGAIPVRSTLIKMGLGLLGVGAITVSSCISSKIDEQLHLEYEEKIKRHKATIGELELEIEQQQKSVLQYLVC